MERRVPVLTTSSSPNLSTYDQQDLLRDNSYTNSYPGSHSDPTPASYKHDVPTYKEVLEEGKIKLNRPVPESWECENPSKKQCKGAPNVNKTSESEGRSSNCSYNNKDFLENSKSVPLVEEHQEFIKSFNAALKGPHRLSYHPAIPRFGLLFWTRDDFYYLKGLIKRNPYIFYTIPVLPAAENIDDPYCYHKELKNVAVRALFKAQAVRAAAESFTHAKYAPTTNVKDSSWTEPGVIGESAFFTEPEYYGTPPPVYSTSATSKLETYKSYGHTNAQHHLGNSLPGSIGDPHLLGQHQCGNCGNAIGIPPLGNEGEFNGLPNTLNMPVLSVCSPPAMDPQVQYEDLSSSLMKKLSDLQLTRGNEGAVVVYRGEQNISGVSSEVCETQTHTKEFYGMYQQSSVKATVSMTELHYQEYNKYIETKSESTSHNASMYSGLMAGFNMLLGKREVVPDFDFGEESISSVSNGEFSPLVISEESLKNTVPTTDLFNKLLHESRSSSSSFTKDDCVDSTPNNCKIRRNSCQSRSRSCSPSPEDAIRKFILLSPFTDNVECVFCKGNNQTEEVYCSHPIRDKAGTVICPYLRKYVCLLCNATGDNAHTIKYCPFNKRGFFAKRENFPPFSNTPGQKENGNDSSTQSLSLSPVSSTPISNESNKSKTRITTQTSLKSIKGRKLDFSISDIMSKSDSSNSNNSGPNNEVKELTTTTNSGSTTQSMEPSSDNQIQVIDNSSFFKQLDKFKKSSKKAWKTGKFI